jgi:hypothetical protein
MFRHMKSKDLQLHMRELGLLLRAGLLGMRFELAEKLLNVEPGFQQLE